MATVTAFTITKQRPRTIQQITSEPAGPTDDFELTGLPDHLVHVFASVQFFDALGDPVVPTAGSIAITIQTIINAPNYEDPEEPTIDATAPTTISWSANTSGVRAVPDGLTGVDTWKLLLFFNQT